jgi:starch synthase
MHIAMIASECEPFAKTGGLADVVDALSRALGELGHEVDVYLPRYRGVTPPEATERLELMVPTGTGVVPVVLHSGRARGYRIRLVDHPASFDRDDFYTIYGTDYPDNGFRFALLGRTALETMRTEGRPADVLHAHDWEGAPAILLLRHRHAVSHGLPFDSMATVFTCHNLAFHGWVPRAQVEAQLDLPATVGVPAGVDLLREGILAADIVNTVSPTFARESLSAEMGSGVDDALRRVGDRYLGIINGIDSTLWDPATDAAIPARFSAANLAGKATCKAALCQQLGLDPNGPLFAMVGRLDPQKGFDLLARAAPDMLAAEARICVLGTGDMRLIGALQHLASEYPSRLAIAARFDRGLARWMYAGADAFVMPSRFEPSGQGQMIAMRYGALPVVRATGGLADTVIDADGSPDSGTGFVFGPADPAALAQAARRAITAFGDRAKWSAIQQRAMATDFSWSRPAREYVSAYERAIDLAATRARPAAV